MLIAIAVLLFIIICLLGAIINRLDSYSFQMSMDTVNQTADLGKIIRDREEPHAVALARAEQNRKDRAKEV